MSDGRIVVDYGTIDQAGADCGAAKQSLQQEHDQLQSYLSPLMNEWTGDAQDQWKQLQDKWYQSYMQLEDFLEKMSKALPEVADELRAGDKSVQNLF
ncbi:WXG100 family type VII secretion target [Amycolatopsis sp. FDAARGOS 1241]|uniref:WXG100 family type VII secretion target n=1 Tax=Amycolatopsis sp. FDAARGOS 1241 TaxID=2778070 RepID=UPI00194FA3D7|nr:WXG100 family type VII secretion target [Amycolatopsis sp. FDAARGOS 1241]QRP45355.1 WXG100 family type VII secretion target [Amycolatopsis sp. FDAARGOS 1241]